jgi:hypothetical protein
MIQLSGSHLHSSYKSSFKKIITSTIMREHKFISQLNVGYQIE